VSEDVVREKKTRHDRESHAECGRALRARDLKKKWIDWNYGGRPDGGGGANLGGEDREETVAFLMTSETEYGGGQNRGSKRQNCEMGERERNKRPTNPLGGSRSIDA